LFAGGLVAVNRIPEHPRLRFRRLDPRARSAAGTAVKRVVPGHGAVSGAEAIRSTTDYLHALDEKINASVRSEFEPARIGG